jgi:hypothetical protein
MRGANPTPKYAPKLRCLIKHRKELTFTRCENVERLHLAANAKQKRALVNKTMKFQVPEIPGNYFTSRVTIRFPWIVFRGVV